MSIDVCIKQKGLFKKTIPLDVIVGDELAFGINDGMRMVGDDQEGNMIFYNPNSIGRGFHISWDEEEKNELKEYLKDIDPLKLTPIEALIKLNELKEISKKS